MWFVGGRFGLGFGFGFGGGGRSGPEILDRPESNFDIAGVPVDHWNQGDLCSCHRNIVPSCCFAFVCPCILWAQIVVRSQIPFLIALKNSCVCFRRQSGYGLFIDYFNLSLLLSILLMVLLVIYHYQLRFTGNAVLGILFICIFGCFLYLMGHTRSAFREKYNLPSVLPVGCEVWSHLVDIFVISLCCLPCSLAQMARHVFQYDRWDPAIGCFCCDPTILPPLEASLDRPIIADEAGLAWTDNRNLIGRGTGNPAGGFAHRTLAANNNLYSSSTTISNSNGNALEPVPAVATTSSTSSVEIVYNADGTIANHSPRRFK